MAEKLLIFFDLLLSIKLFVEKKGTPTRKERRKNTRETIALKKKRARKNIGLGLSKKNIAYG